MFAIGTAPWPFRGLITPQLSGLVRAALRTLRPYGRGGIRVCSGREPKAVCDLAQLRFINSPITRSEGKMKFGISILAVVVSFTALAQAQTICPDGSYVSGSTCQIAPNGSYVSGGPPPQIAPNGSYTSGTPRITPNGGYVGGRGAMTICPDGSYVTGSCHIAPNGKYVGD